MCEMPDVFDENLTKARKEHKCCECYETIRVGEDYMLSSGLWDGQWDSYRQCCRCNALMKELQNSGFADCVTFTAVYDAVHESWNEKDFPMHLLSGKDLIAKADSDIEDMQNGRSAMDWGIECGDDGVWMGEHFEYWQSVNCKNNSVPGPRELLRQSKARSAQ